MEVQTHALVQVPADVYIWLAELLGLSKPRVAVSGPAGRGANQPGLLPLPARVVAGLLSGEMLIELFNAIFSKHGVKRKLGYSASDRQRTWSQVGRGLHQLSVELDEESLAALAKGDLNLLTELLQELHTVYREWVAEEAKRRRKRQAERQQQQQQQRQQPPQGYARVTPHPSPTTAPQPPHLSGAEASEFCDADAPGEQTLEVAAVSEPVSPSLQPQEVNDNNKNDNSDDKGRGEEVLELGAARTAPELLGLSLVQALHVGAAQARSLLADGARKLGRAFADGSEKNSTHLGRWLQLLERLVGTLRELLLPNPEHVPFVLDAAAQGLQAAKPELAEASCHVLVGLCQGLGELAAGWLLQARALGDLCALASRQPSARSSVVSLCWSCCRGSLKALLTQHLKQVTHSEQEYLASAHLLLGPCFQQQDAAGECSRQGVCSYFLDRCVRCLQEEVATAAVRQAAALLSTDLWLATPEEPSSLEPLLAALRRAARSRQALACQFVALGCLSRLLTALCERCDPLNTPAVYRTLVYSLVEADQPQARDFAMWNLIALLQRQDGVPVGILVELMASKCQASSGESLCAADVELFLAIARHPRCTQDHAEQLAQVLARCAVENRALGRAASLPLLTLLRRFGPLGCFFEQFVQVALACLLRRGAPQGQAAQLQELLAKIACLREPELEATLRRLLGEVCRAYLASYEMLHPSLQGILDLWPDDAVELDRWVREQFAQPSGHDQDRLPPETQPLVSELPPLALLSVSPSLPSSPGHVQATAAAALPSILGTAPEAGEEGPLSASEGSYAGNQGSSPLAEDAQVLRRQLEEAKEEQRRAIEEAEQLRGELGEAQALHRRVEDEMTQLQKRRDELMLQKARREQENTATLEAADKDRKARRRKQQGTSGPTAEDLEKAAALIASFHEPLQFLHSKYSHKQATLVGARLAMSLDAFERLLTEVDILPSRLPRKVLAQALRASGVQFLEEGAMLLEDFLAVLPHLAVRCFAAKEATPFQDFGVPVPLGEEAAARLQVQALLQHLVRAVETSRVAALRTARSAMARALRLHVVQYAEATLAELNGRLEREEELRDGEVPEGFEVLKDRPVALHSVPEGLPVRRSERHCSELLDALLAEALNIHFLEPQADAGPGRRVAVCGFPDLAALRETTQAAETRQPRALSRNASERDVAAAGAVKSKAVPDQSQSQSQSHSLSRETTTRQSSAPEFAAPSQPSQPAAAALGRRTRGQEVPRPQPSAQRANSGPAEAAPEARDKLPATSPSKPRRLPAPADPATRRQDKAMQRHRAVADGSRGRQEAMQGVLRSDSVQRLLRSVESNLRRAFDFFARWKGGDASAMPLLGFLTLGECFGILNKEALKVVFRQVAGQGLSFETFPEVLLCCVVRTVELEQAEAGTESTEDTALWSRGFHLLCQHMLLVNAKALRNCLETYRRTGEALPAFSLGEAGPPVKVAAEAQQGLPSARSASEEQLLPQPAQVEQTEHVGGMPSIELAAEEQLLPQPPQTEQIERDEGVPSLESAAQEQPLPQPQQTEQIELDEAVPSVEPATEEQPLPQPSQTAPPKPDDGAPSTESAAEEPHPQAEQTELAEGAPSLEAEAARTDPSEVLAPEQPQRTEQTDLAEALPSAEVASEEQPLGSQQSDPAEAVDARTASETQAGTVAGALEEPGDATGQ